MSPRFWLYHHTSGIKFFSPARVSTFAFLSKVVTWYFTVLSQMFIRWPISLFDIPWQTSLRILAHRGVTFNAVRHRDASFGSSPRGNQM